MFNLKDKKTRLVLILTVLISVGIGYNLGRNGYALAWQQANRVVKVVHQEPPRGISKELDLTLFWRVLEELQKGYYNPQVLDGQKMLYGAIKGLVSSLGDPYTAFFTPEQNASFKDGLEGVFEGIGAAPNC